MDLLITDLDNTLYDWVTYFATSFDAMVDSLVEELDLERERVLDEFKAMHQQCGDSEQPFAVLDLPSVRQRFGDLDRLEIKQRLDGPLHAFNSARRRSLRLYDGVFSVLSTLRAEGWQIVGHTEAIKANAYYRLQKLGIVHLFDHLYVLESSYLGHPDPERAAALRPPEGFVRVLPRQERKPNPGVLLDILRQEKADKERAWYIGDSLLRDISMAQAAGVKAVWARYGTRFDRQLWEKVVRVTHWTELDVEREVRLRHQYAGLQPDFTIDSFEELLGLLNVGSPCRALAM